MEAQFSPLFTAGIFLLAFLSLLGVVFNWLLSPVKENQSKLEAKVDRLEAGLLKLELAQSEMKQDIGLIKDAVLKS